MQLQLIKTFNNCLVSKINGVPACEDQIDCFLKSLACVRMSLEIETIIAYHEIRPVIYKQQMAHIQHQCQQFLFTHHEPQHLDLILGSLGVRTPGPYLRDVLQLPSNSNF